LLHGEGVALGTVLAFRLSARLGLCAEADAIRVARHFDSVGLASEIGMLNRRLSASTLIGHMRRDKKTRDGQMTFVLVRGIGQAFTCRDVSEAAVADVLRESGCAN